MANAAELYKRGIAMGRTPAYTLRGDVRGFRSVPGARQSAMDASRNPVTGFTPKTEWDRQFGKQIPQPPVSPMPAAPGSLTTDTTQMPPPGAFSTPIKFSLAPDLATTSSNVSDAASVTARPYTPPVFDSAAARQEGITRNQTALKTFPTPVDPNDPNFKVVQSPFGTPGVGVSGRYGFGYSRPASEVAAEQSANQYRASLDSILGSLLF